MQVILVSTIFIESGTGEHGSVRRYSFVEVGERLRLCGPS